MGIYEELNERGLIKQVTDEDEIRKIVNEGNAKFYIGFDPTASSLHIGHYMTISLLMRLQKAGNIPVILLGGGTAHVGDPSGKSEMRKMMDKDEIDRNVECFKKQISKFIDISKAIFVNNADWLLKLNYVDVLRDIGPHFTVNNMLRAECYKQRMEKGLSFLEFNYMIMQSYDFYHLFKTLDCRIQFGGDDQWSNMLAGTELIRRKTGKDAYALTIPLLLTSDGKKMGKTVGGAVWLDPNKLNPFDFYQYWRNVDDKEVVRFLKMLTFVSLDEINSLVERNTNINDLKELLAYEMTKIVHGEEDAIKSRERARNIFKGNADDLPIINIDISHDIDIKELLVISKLCSSKGDARRLIEQNGLTVENNKVTNPNLIISLNQLKSGLKVQKGKKTFAKLIVK